MVGADQGAALVHKGLQLLFKALPQQVEHGGNHQLVAADVALLVHNVHGDAHAPQRPVVGLDLLHIMHALVPWALGVVDGPAVLPVIYHSHLCRVLRSGNFLKFFQTFSYFRYLLKYSGIILAIMIDHCTMELFRGTLALSKLEIQNTVGSVGNSLHGSCMKHSRFL